MTEGRIREAKRNVRQHIADGLLRVKDDTIKKSVNSFVDNGESSVQVAALLYQI